MGVSVAVGDGVFPAYVGMSPDAKLLYSFLESVPRIRGDEPGLTRRGCFTRKCSPHTWG